MSAKQLLVIKATGIVRAPADRVYGILADYRNGHPRILPPQFRELTVERGGVGAGTIVSFQMRVAGRTQSFRAAITEPKPGRVLVETDLGSKGVVTTFTVNPAERADWSEVGISTTIETRPGVLGAIERFVAAKVLRPIYVEELEILNRVATARA